MAQDTLEERVNTPNAKTSIWDFLVSAYSSNKTIKIGLTLAGLGYSYTSSAIASGIFYLGAKTIGITAKYAAQFLTHPINYLKNFNLKEKVTETIKFYNPLGKYRRPTFMGGTLSAVTYFTGF
ncbi:hypothetical protein HYX06_05305 [Candidatus Woesearchaeota archaeon]|nr:hypothetical protein [Candidatus Woesearchaeota archaeon]